MTVVADLETLKASLGARGSSDDELLQDALDVATSWVSERTYAEEIPLNEVQQAILLIASRLYKRRQSPEGVAGWGDLGVIRILASDPDINRLLEHHLDMTREGIA